MKHARLTEKHLELKAEYARAEERIADLEAKIINAHDEWKKRASEAEEHLAGLKQDFKKWFPSSQ